MRKLMKKKVNVLGKEISVFMIALIAVTGLASAALVPYLSNVITGMVIVSSPMEVAFDSGYTDYEESWNIRGGESFTFDTYQKNGGTQDLDVYRVIIMVESPDGEYWTGDEFESINLEDDRYPLGTPGEILGDLCHIKDDGSLIPFADIDTLDTDMARLIYAEGCNSASALYTHAGGSEIVNHITIDTNPHLYPGTYTMKLFYTDDLDSVLDAEAELFP